MNSPFPACCRPISPLLALLFTSGVSLADGPVIPGLHGKHPLDEMQTGKLLIGELRCASCHDGMDATRMKAAPDLSAAGSRLTVDFMERFIADPAAVHPGTTMPAVLDSLPAEKRKEVAGDIAAYLSSLRGAAPEKPEGEIDPYDGKEMFANIGCIACHSPRNEANKELLTEGVISLGHLPGKYQPGQLAEFLRAPLAVRPSGRMPDMKLSLEDAAELAAYLTGKENPAPEPEMPSASRIAAGRKAFQEHNCTACHQPEKEAMPSLQGPALVKIDPTRGCLSDAPGAAPNFHLATDQKAAIRKATAKLESEDTPTARINLQLTRLNCIACHVRDDFGGVDPKLDSFFHSTEEALGNEARIPPPLTQVGAKLRPEWLDKVLYEGRSVRPYMNTRMPQFGETGLADLAALFAEADHLPPVNLPEPDRTNNKEVRAAAHELLGDKGLNCIACHNYNGKESPGMKGIDLMTSYQRLKPEWFHSYMVNPAKFRPGIIMPSYWPGGKALRTEILDGDTDRQLGALWYNFSLGRSAPDPSGLRSEPSVLKVTDEAMTYRGRSKVAGYRGIAVGFPGGINYAFNAQNGALTAIWQGDFVRVGWQGQGAGDFDPMGKHIQLSQDVGFLQTKEAPAVWPQHPETSKEQPVNPDPLYPKNLGYQFVGYSLDEKSSVPSFRYRCGEVLIEDKSDASEKSLVRNFSIKAPKEQTLWFRALTGSITSESKTVFKTEDLKLTVPEGTALLRPAADGGQELLIKLTLPKGEFITTFEYELLR
jgi:mono/diheme cytochrome c family protein